MLQNAVQNTNFVTVADLVERWGLSPTKIHRMIEDKYLAAIRVNGVLSIPEEFVQGDEPLQSLRGTLLALHDAGFNDEEALIWMLTDNDELGERPVDALLGGRKSAVRRATQSLAF